MSSGSFLVGPLGFFTYSIMSSAVSVILLFQNGFFVFLFPLCLQWLGLPKLCWIIVARVDIFVLFLILVECFQVFTIEYDVCCGFVIYDCSHVEICSLCAHLLESFSHKWVLNFVESFFCIYRDDHMVLFFNFLMLYITLTDLWILTSPYFPGINPTWSWCMVFLLCCWIWFANILLRIFASVFISDNWPVIVSFHGIFVWRGEGNGNPLQCSCLENPMDREA